MSKEEVVHEIHRGVRRNFNRRHVVLKGIDDLWQADLIDMQNIRKHNRGFNFILVIIDCFSKFAWAVPLKTKAKNEVCKAFEKVLEYGRIPINLQTDLGTEFYNKNILRLLKSHHINHYSTYSTKKASIVERLIRTLKSRLYKHFSLAGNYKWLGKPLIDVVDSYNNTTDRTTKHRPAVVNKVNEAKVSENIANSRATSLLVKPKLKEGDCVRISKYKGCFYKGYTPNWSTELFNIIKVNKTRPITYHLTDQYIIN